MYLETMPFNVYPKVLPKIDKLRKDFEKDASLPDGPLDPRTLKCVEMRAMLEDPIGQKYIGQFAKEAMTQAGGCG